MFQHRAASRCRFGGGLRSDLRLLQLGFFEGVFDERSRSGPLQSSNAGRPGRWEVVLGLAIYDFWIPACLRHEHWYAFILLRSFLSDFKFWLIRQRVTQPFIYSKRIFLSYVNSSGIVFLQTLGLVFTFFFALLVKM